MTAWEFIEFWSNIKCIALQNWVEVSCDLVDCLDMIEFRVRSPRTMKGTAFCISRYDFENLPEIKKMLTEKLLDMIREVKGETLKM